MNGKSQNFYDIIFSSKVNILTLENKYELNIQTIVADEEKELVNVIFKQVAMFSFVMSSV